MRGTYRLETSKAYEVSEDMADKKARWVTLHNHVIKCKVKGPKNFNKFSLGFCPFESKYSYLSDKRVGCNKRVG